MPAPKKNAVSRIIKSVAKKAANKSVAKPAKKGFKIKPGTKGFEDALPTSNVKVRAGKKSSPLDVYNANKRKLPSRTTPAKIQPVKGKRGTAKTWGRKDDPSR